MPDEETLALGEAHSSGKECHAYAVIAGDLVKFSRSERTGGEIFYFPGSKYACVLQQYGESMNLLLENLGVRDLSVLAAPDDVLGRILGFSGLKSLWNGLVAIDMLVKAACEIRPYEINAGETDRAHNANLGDVQDAFAHKIRRDFNNIPIPTLIFSGTATTLEKTKLEAFVYQVRQFQKKRGSAVRAAG